MKIQSVVEKNKWLPITASVLAAVVVVYLCWQATGVGAPYTVNTFYTDDDGATFFGGEGKDIFDMEFNRPKPAYKAVVYSSADGSNKFVGYMIRHSRGKYDAFLAAKARHEKLQQPGKVGDFQQIRAAMEAVNNATKSLYNDAEVKRPGPGQQWVSINSPAGQEVVKVTKSPAGATNVQVVLP